MFIILLWLLCILCYYIVRSKKYCRQRKSPIKTNVYLIVNKSFLFLLQVSADDPLPVHGVPCGSGCHGYHGPFRWYFPLPLDSGADEAIQSQRPRTRSPCWVSHRVYANKIQGLISAKNSHSRIFHNVS